MVWSRPYRPYHFKFFKGCLPQSLFGSFLNTLSHLCFFAKTTFKINYFWNKGRSWMSEKVYNGPLMDGPLSVCTFLSPLLVQFFWVFTLSLYFVHVVLFSCCTLFMLQFYRVALFSCYTLSLLNFFVLHLFNVAIFAYRNLLIFAISLTFHVLFVLLFFHVSLFSCSTFFMFKFLHAAFFSCFAISMLHFSPVALFLSYTFFHIAFFLCYNLFG